VSGGGDSGQAGAIRHGITKALLEADPELRPNLKKPVLLPATRGSRSGRSTALPLPAPGSSSPSVNSALLNTWCQIAGTSDTRGEIRKDLSPVFCFLPLHSGDCHGSRSA